MVTKDVAVKIEPVIIESCRAFFEKDLPGRAFPAELTAALQVSRDKSFGDISSTVAMRIASLERIPPAETAAAIARYMRERIQSGPGRDIIEDVTTLKGFINIRLSKRYYLGRMLDIIEDGSSFGRAQTGEGLKVNIEFVSANPTGPLTIAHGRQAALGEALARIMEFSGYEVTREYYLNDMGRQIDMLGESVRARYRALFGEDAVLPEDGYQGEYINDIARAVKDARGDSLLSDRPENRRIFRVFAMEHMLSMIRRDLADLGVEFGQWTAQSSIEQAGEVEAALGLLQEKGLIYDKDGARWFSSTRFGDDKDRVVVKSDSSYTYLAPDIAYHLDKYRRGYDRVIDLLGPDHHGYLKRMEAAVEALGYDPGSLNILIVQLVSLQRSGRSLSMSTRRGEFLTLREVMDEVGRDVTRYYFLSRRLDSHLEFDLDLAKEQCKENPVYYIQYAHARICSIKKFSSEQTEGGELSREALERLEAEEEMALVRKLSEFPLAVESSLEALEPNRLVTYLNELARLFHSFYTECRVVSDDVTLSRARLCLVECVQIVLSNGLGLLNISLPEKM